MVMSIDAEAFDKINMQSGKNGQQIRIGGLPKFNKNMYKNSIANIYLIMQTAIFPLRSGTRQERPSSPLFFFFTIILDVLTGAVRQQGNKRYMIGKEEIKLCSQMPWSSM